MRLKKAHPWYSFDKLMSYNAAWNFCAGARGLGKTFDAKKRSIKKNIKTGEQFIYLRRHRTEVGPAKRTFFNDLVEEFPDWDFRVMGNEAQRAPISTREEKKREWFTMGYFVSLSTAQTQKSVSFHRVTTIIFDEFIAEKGRLYLPDEANLFLGFFSTVDRNQDKTTVLFLANSVSIMNPYFIAYEIRPDICGELGSSHNGFIAWHFPESADFMKSVYETRFGKFIQGTDFGDYAVGNTFDDAHDNLIDIKPDTAKYQFTLETKYGKVAVWYDRKSRQYFVQRKLPRGNEILFTLLPEKMEEGKILVTFSDGVLSYLRTAFRQGMVSFDKPSTRNSFIEISLR